MSHGASEIEQLAKRFLALQHDVSLAFRARQIHLQNSHSEDTARYTDDLWLANLRLSALDYPRLAHDWLQGPVCVPVFNCLSQVAKRFKVLSGWNFFPMPVRYLFLCLEVPFLRLNLQHLSVLQDTSMQHANALLDLFVQVGSQISISRLGQTDRVYLEMQAMTARILEDTSENGSAISAAYHEFRDFIYSLNHQVRLLQKRMRDAHIGAIKGKQAIGVSRSFVEKSLATAPVPYAIKQVLEDVWTQVLASIALVSSIESPAFKAKCDFVTQIITHYTYGYEYAENMDKAARVNQYNTAFLALWQRFEEAVSDVNVSEFKLSCIHQDLRSTHLRFLDQIERVGKMEPVQESSSIQKFTGEKEVFSAAQMLEENHLLGESSIMTWASLDEGHRSAEHESLCEKSIAFVDSIREFDWLMLWLGRMHHESVQLLFHDEYHQTFIFINHLGERVCEKTHDDLVIAHQHGNLIKLEIHQHAQSLVKAYERKIFSINERLNQLEINL